jgi:trk system potassium uptake protein TrkA
MRQPRQALVIGLGQFGLALAEALTRNGVDVVAVDDRADRVQQAGELVAEAVRMDATDEAQLARLAPATRDLCIVAIGDDAREASIIVTALLRQLGAPRVVARATNPVHERILSLVGAHDVVNPERNYGARLAARLAYRGVVDIIPLGDELIITELEAPAMFAGRSLRELELRRRFQVSIVAIRRSGAGSGQLVLPGADDVIRADDVLLLVSTPEASSALSERL